MGRMEALVIPTTPEEVRETWFQLLYPDIDLIEEDTIFILLKDEINKEKPNGLDTIFWDTDLKVGITREDESRRFTRLDGKPFKFLDGMTAPAYSVIWSTWRDGVADHHVNLFISLKTAKEIGFNVSTEKFNRRKLILNDE